jgi:hypothetical protein
VEAGKKETQLGKEVMKKFGWEGFECQAAISTRVSLAGARTGNNDLGWGKEERKERTTYRFARAAELAWKKDFLAVSESYWSM